MPEDMEPYSHEVTDGMGRAPARAMLLAAGLRAVSMRAVSMRVSGRRV